LPSCYLRLLMFSPKRPRPHITVLITILNLLNSPMTDYSSGGYPRIHQLCSQEGH
jgi:hypothetical protein